MISYSSFFHLVEAVQSAWSTVRSTMLPVGWMCTYFLFTDRAHLVATADTAAAVGQDLHTVFRGAIVNRTKYCW